MQALRLARSSGLASVARTTQHQHVLRRTLATATVEVTGTTSQPAGATSGGIAGQGPIALANIEAQWAKLSNDDRAAVYEQIEELQAKDWKELSLEEKKAAYFVAFGPHGPRAPRSQPGDGLRIVGSTVALVGAAGVLFFVLKGLASPPPKSMSKEWQEASNERAVEMKLNPITGITSEGYSGKGFVQSK